MGRLVGVYSNVGTHIVMFTFLCAWRSGEPRGGHECPEARWFAPEDALGLITHPANRAKLRDALAGSTGVAYRAYRFRPEEGNPYAGYETLVEIEC